MLKKTTNSLKLGKQGLGCMAMSEFYGEPMADRDAIALIQQAFDQGIALFDTADVYGYGKNEILLGQAVKKMCAEGSKREAITIASKYGILRDEHDKAKRGVDNSYAYTLAACNASLQRLGTEVAYIDLYYVHRIANDGKQLEEAMRAMAQLLKDGKIKAVGLSEASASQIRLANKALANYTDAQHQIAAVQTEYSLLSRAVEKNGVLATCRELGIHFVAYSPLSRALLTGDVETAEQLPEGDFRRSLPRFQAENIRRNKKMIAQVQSMAQAKNCTTAQIALSWLMQKENVVPIPGTRQSKHLLANIAATAITLNNAELASLDRIQEAKGDRYTAQAMLAYGLTAEMEKQEND